MDLSTVTLVTCYYKIKSKHTFNEYARWIRNLLLTIKSNIIIFTSSDQANWLYSLAMFNRYKNESSTYGETGIRVIIKELQDLEIIKKYPNIWDNQYMKDPTREIRTKECYMIWNSKLSLIQEAIKLNPFGSDKFIWNDIGSLRDINFIYNNYSNLVQYPKYEYISKDKIDIILINAFQNPEQLIFQNEIHLSGAIFGGGLEPLKKLIDLFNQNFDFYLNNGYFIGCDQQILATCYQQAPTLFNLILPDYSEQIIDKWFYLYYHYSKISESEQCILDDDKSV